MMIAIIAMCVTSAANAQLTNIQRSSGHWDVLDSNGRLVTSGRVERVSGTFYNVQRSSGHWDVLDRSGRLVTSGRAERASETLYNVQRSSGHWDVINSSGRLVTSGRMNPTVSSSTPSSNFGVPTIAWLQGLWGDNIGPLFVVNDIGMLIWQYYPGYAADFIGVDGDRMYFRWRNTQTIATVTRISSNQVRYHHPHTGVTHIVTRR